jgi:hypothetical protein
MTKKDMALVARAFAYCEEHIEQDRGSRPDEVEAELATLSWTVEKMAEHIAIDHPRFKKGLFEIEAMPIKNRRLRDDIVAKLRPNPFLDGEAF